MKRLCVCAGLLTAEIVIAGCGGSSMQPSPPATSTLTFQVAAAALNPADSGSYTTASATFGASVRTTCVPDPNVPNSVCPDLMVLVRGTDGRSSCQLWAFAPAGRSLNVGSYPKAAASYSADTAGFLFNCSRGGTACNGNVSSFTIHELQSNPNGVVTRLHMTFEQTCLGGFPPAVGPFGKCTGELWIIDGTAPFL